MDWPPGAVENLDGKVSDYAMAAPIEFVAEVFAGLMAGRVFDDEVLTWYDRFGGVRA